MTTLCLYCSAKVNPEDKSKSSYEHVILRSIGGKKGRRDICCSKCNNRLGNTVDQALAEFCAPFLNMINADLDTRSGEPPELHGLKTADGRTVSLLVGGKPAFEPEEKVSVREEGDKVRVSIQAESVEELSYLLKHQKKRFDLNAEDLSSAKGKIVREYGTQIKFSTSIDTQIRRAVGKMLLNVCSLALTRELVRSSQFESFIARVTGEEDARDIAVLTSEFPSECSKYDGQLTHRTLVYGLSNEQRVCGLFQLFGSLTFGAVLSEEWSGDDFCFGMECDPVKGEERCSDEFKVAELSLPESFQISYDDEVSLMRSQFKGLGSKAMAHQAKAARDQMIKEVIGEQFAQARKEGAEYVRPEDVDRISTELAERFVLMNFGGRKEEVLEPEDILKGVFTDEDE